MGRKFIPVQKFDRINKSKAKIPVGHTRTGACTSKGACYHGKKK